MSVGGNLNRALCDERTERYLGERQNSRSRAQGKLDNARYAQVAESLAAGCTHLKRESVERVLFRKHSKRQSGLQENLLCGMALRAERVEVGSRCIREFVHGQGAANRKSE